MKTIFVGGTWSRHTKPPPITRCIHAIRKVLGLKRDDDDDEVRLPWYRRGSMFDRYLRGLGYERVEQDNDPLTPDPGYWSTDVGGLVIPSILHALFGWAVPWFDPHRTWNAHAADFAHFLASRQRELAGGVLVVAHSHAGQVIAYAMRYAHEECLRIPPIFLVTVDTPIRMYDMARNYRVMSGMVERWTHLYSQHGWRARMRWLGSWFGPRVCLWATENIEIRGWHSGILRSRTFMPQIREILRHATAV